MSATILGALASLIVTALTAYCILKKYQAHLILLAAGITLMLVAIFLGVGPEAILPAKVKSTGFIGFDIFKFFERTLSARVAGLGLIIMSAGGISAYLDKIGASKIMVDALIGPLRALHAPYVLMACSYIIGAVLKVFIPSAAGLAMLLMVTLFPLLLAVGVSRLAAAALIISTGCFDVGPGSGNTNLAAVNAGIPVAVYFVKYEIPVAIVGYITMAASHYIVQRYYDKKEGVGIAGGMPPETMTVAEDTSAVKHERAPGYYGFLPLLPVTLLLLFNNEIGIKGFSLDVVTVMLLSFVVIVTCECFRHKSVKTALKISMVFYENMGKMFASTISLIVAGEVFAQGLMATGTVGLLIDSAQKAGFGPIAMAVVVTALITVSCVVMGSGNAPFFAFAALAPKIAAGMNFHPIILLLPMWAAAGLGRALSPITAVVVAVAGVANLSPVDLVRRNLIPVSLSLLTATIASLIVPSFYH